MVVATEGVSASRPRLGKLRRLARENKALALRVENAKLKRRAARVEEAASSLLADQFVDRLDYLPSNFGFQARVQHGVNTYSSLNDRRDGRNAPFIEDEVDAAYARGLARWLTGSAGAAVGVSENLKNYVVGTGFVLSASTRKSRSAPEGLVDDVQLYVDEVLASNRWACDLDREFYWRLERDGETFLALYYRPDGGVQLRFIEPEQIEDPRRAPWEDAELDARFRRETKYATSWSFGVHTYDHDTNHVLGYCVRWAPGEELDYLPASQVIHVKANVDRNIKRGLTSFYPVWKWLTKQEELLSKTSDGATRLAAIAYIVQYALATQEQVKSMRTAAADQKRKSRTVTGSEDLYRRNGHGSEVVDLPLGQEYREGPHGAERGNAFLAVVQGLLRMVGVRFCMPEYMVSGDASNGNYSSSIEAGGPFNKFCEARQGTLKTYFGEVLWKCLEHAYLRGRFARHAGLTWAQLRACVDLSFTPPDVKPNQGQETTARRDLMHSAGILSTETYQEQEGLDPDKEKARGAVGSRLDGGGAAAPGQAPALGGAPGGEVAAVEDTALNGAQVSSMLDMLEKAKSGLIPAASVAPMLKAAFPALRPEQIEEIVSPLAELAKAPVTGPAADGFTKMRRIDWQRTEKAIKDVAAGLQAGTTTEPMAMAFLQQLGLTPDQATGIVADASDGTIDQVEIIESVREHMWLNRVWEGYP